MVNQARLLMNYPAAVHDNEIGDAHDIESLGQPRRLFSIDLKYDRTARHFRSNLFHFGSGHSTGSAPGGPEIDEHGNTRATDNLVEQWGVDVNRVRNRGQGCFA